MLTTSFPKQDIRILLLEGVSPSTVDTLRAAGYSRIDFHEKSLPEDELKARIAEAHFIGIRSRTQLTAEVLSHARRLIGIGCSASAPTRSTSSPPRRSASRSSTRPTPTPAASPSW